jgi:hypothetical protein
LHLLNCWVSHFISVSIYYSAIPPKSEFYQRLQRDKAFAILIVSFFPMGWGTFNAFEMKPLKLNYYLDEIIEENQEVFGDELAADWVITELRTALRRTRQAYPGIENRIGALEKCYFEIEQRLIEVLLEQQDENASELVSRLIPGERSLTPHFEFDVEKTLTLVSTSLVKQGAKMLRKVNSKTAFLSDRDADWYRGWFEEWRNLYLAAARRGEEIVVGATG